MLNILSKAIKDSFIELTPIYSFILYFLYLLHSFSNEYLRYIYDNEQNFILFIPVTVTFMIYIFSCLIYLRTRKNWIIVTGLSLLLTIINICILFHFVTLLNNTWKIYFIYFFVQLVINIYILYKSIEKKKLH